MRRSKQATSPSKFAWRTHPVGIFAKILAWLVAQRVADARGCRVVQVPRTLLWAEVTSRLPYLPEIWQASTGRPLTADLLWNRVFYMFRTHRSDGPGALIEGVSPEHPMRSARLRPFVPGVRAVFEHHQGVVPRELAEWVCSEPTPSVEEVRARIAAWSAVGTGPQ